MKTRTKSEAPASGWNVGDRAAWQDKGRYYKGTVLEVRGDFALILQPDGAPEGERWQICFDHAEQFSLRRAN
jgi:hypothetical protein